MVDKVEGAILAPVAWLPSQPSAIFAWASEGFLVMPTSQTNNKTGSFSFLEYAAQDNLTFGGSPRVSPASTQGSMGDMDHEAPMPIPMQMHYCTNCTGMVFDSTCVDCGHNRNEDELLFERPAMAEAQPVASTSGRSNTPVIIWDDQMTAHDEGAPKGSPHPER